MKTEVEVLEQIHESVKSTHWIKRSYAGFKKEDTRQRKECYCLAGHINMASGCRPAENSGTHLILPPDPRELYFQKPERVLACAVGQRVWAAIKTYEPQTTTREIEGWNDRHKTTREDVLAVVKIALKAAKQDAKKVAA